MSWAKRSIDGCSPLPVPLPSFQETDDDDLPVIPPTYLLNVRFLLGSMVVMGGVAAGFEALHDSQQYRLRGVLRQRAEKQLAAGDAAAATGLLRSYLSLSPDDLDARLQLDTLQWARAQAPPDVERALLSSEALLRDHPDLADIRRRQIERLLFIGRHTDALDHIEILRASGADDVALDVWEGLCHESARDYRAAEQAYMCVARGAGDFSPVPFGAAPLTWIDVVVRLAELLLNKLDEGDRAFRLVDEAIDRYPKSAELRLLRARLTATSGGSAQAVLKHLDEAQKLGEGTLPECETVLLYLTHVARYPDLQTERIERVIGYCHRLAELGTGDARLYEQWAALESRRGRPDAALEVLRLGRAAFPDAPMLGALLADELISQQQLAEARQLITQAEAVELPAGVQDYLNGRIAFALENWPVARTCFRSVQFRGDDVHTTIQSRAGAFLKVCNERLGITD